MLWPSKARLLYLCYCIILEWKYLFFLPFYIAEVIYRLGPLGFTFGRFSSIITKDILKLYIYFIQDLFHCLRIMLYLVKVKYTTGIMCTTTQANILVVVQLLVNFKSIQNNRICAPSKQNFKKVVIEGMSLLAKFIIAKFRSFFLITLKTLCQFNAVIKVMFQLL